MVAPLAAIAASFSAAALARPGVSDAPDLVTLAALVTFLPGMRLTIGMRELATEHLQSGVANTASALVQLLGLVFGVGIGRSIADAGSAPRAGDRARSRLHRAVHRRGSRDGPRLHAHPACAVPRCPLHVRRDRPRARGQRDRHRDLRPEAAVFVAALTVGVVGGLLGSRPRRSPLVFIVPGSADARARERRVQQRPATPQQSDRERDQRGVRHVRDRDVDRIRPDRLGVAVPRRVDA